MRKRLLLSIVLGILLIGLVSAWSVNIDSPVAQDYDDKIDEFTWSISGISLDNITDCWYTLDGGANNVTINNCADTLISTINPSDEDYNTWTVYAQDDEANIESGSVTFCVDSISPVINWIVPATNPVAYASDTINLQISYTEVNPESIEFEIYDSANHKKYSLFDSIIPFTTSTSKSNLIDDEYTCYVTIFDTIGHSTTIDTLVIIDNIDPVVNIGAPSDGTLHKDDVDIETSATDDGSGIERIEIEIDGGLETTCYSEDCDYIWDSSSVIDGFYEIKAIAYDKAGNSDETSINIEVDNTNPIITLNPPNPQIIEVFDSYTEDGAVAIDIRDGDISGEIIIDDSEVNTNILGTYTVYYSVIDEAGNIGYENRSVIIQDTTIPIITLIGDNPQTIQFGDSYVELGASALDNYDGDISGSIVIDSSLVNTNLLGNYNVTYDVMDSSGNPAITKIRTVNVVDTTPPQISINSPVSGNYNHHFTEIDFDVSDPNLDSCWYSLNGITNITTNCSESVTGINSVEGANTWYIYANDTQGNEAYSNVSFNIDTITPSITIFSPENITYTTNNIDLNVSTDESNCDWKYSLDDGITNISFTLNETLSLSNGNYNLSVYVADSVGNENSSMISFKVDVPVYNPSSGGGGGSCSKKWNCTLWSEWSECINESQNRTCLEKERVSCGKGLTINEIEQGEIRNCIIPIEQVSQEQDEPDIMPEPEPEEQGFFSGITGSAIGFAKSGTGILTLSVIGLLAVSWTVLHFRKKRL